MTLEEFTAQATALRGLPHAAVQRATIRLCIEYLRGIDPEVDPHLDILEAYLL